MARKRNGLMTLLIMLPLALVVSCGETERWTRVGWSSSIRRSGRLRSSGTNLLIPKTRTTANLPPLTYALPKDPKEMGQEPKTRRSYEAGYFKAKQIVIFDPAARTSKPSTTP